MFLIFLYSPGTYVSGCKFQFGKRVVVTKAFVTRYYSFVAGDQYRRIGSQLVMGPDVDLATSNTKAKKEKERRRKLPGQVWTKRNNAIGKTSLTLLMKGTSFMNFRKTSVRIFEQRKGFSKCYGVCVISIKNVRVCHWLGTPRGYPPLHPIPPSNCWSNATCPFPGAQGARVGRGIRPC